MFEGFEPCKNLAPPSGIEPETPSLENSCSIRLSYGDSVGEEIARRFVECKPVYVYLALNVHGAAAVKWGMKTILSIFAALLFLFGVPCFIAKGYAPIVGAILTTGGILLLAALAILGRLDDLRAAVSFDKALNRNP